MKRYLIGKLFGGLPARQYLTVAIPDGEIQEKAILHFNGNNVDVSFQHFVFCQVPFLIGVWVAKASSPPTSKASLRILDRSGADAVVIDLAMSGRVSLMDGEIWLFQIVRSDFKQISWIHQRLLLKYFHMQRGNAVSFKELDCFCATYHFPRKVVLTCHGQHDNFNLFPMDLQGYVEAENVFALGLRNTNVTLQEILKSKKLVVCDVAADHKEALLSLGSHHSSKPPRFDDLPFSWNQSELYATPIPNIAHNYFELEIIQHSNLGTHTLMIGKVINKGSKGTRAPSLYHLHTLCAMTQPINYDVV